MESNDERKEILKKILINSSNIVAYVGTEMVTESGINCFAENDEIYDVEDKYGYDLNYLLSARFYETRTPQFFDFYKNDMIQCNKPGKSFNVLLELQKKGKLRAVVSRDIYMLAKRAGCRNTIELTGNIFDNTCQKCGRKYSLNYIMKSDHVPLCSSCKARIRPNVLLVGEQMDNVLLTKAANAIENADVFLMLGSHLTEEGERQMLKYYDGDKLVVINSHPKLIDERADLCVKGKVCDVLKDVLNEIN